MYIKNKIYKDILKNIIVQTVDIIFLNEDNKILLWLRKNSPLKWEYYLPGWRRLKNETIQDSVIRKSKEEIWINIDIDKLKFLWVYDDIYEDSMYENISSHYSPIIFVYKLSKEEEKNLKIDEQHENFIFFDLTDNSLCDILKVKINDLIKII